MDPFYGNGKYRNSELIISDLLSEKAYTTRVVEEAKDTIHQQEEEILSCRATINDITGQLSASYSAREEGAIRAARTIEELNLTSSKLSKYPYVACDTSELGNNFELETAYKHIVSSYVSTNPITLVSDHSAAEQKTERYTDT